MSDNTTFNKEQQSYLQGFVLGADVARAVKSLPILSGLADTTGTNIQLGPNSPTTSPPGPSDASLIHWEAQNRFLAAGKKLVTEEQAKRDKNALDIWDEINKNAVAGKFPQGTDVFLYKFHGLFQVAPAQNAFMCRLRIPGGVMKGYQLRGLADVADQCAGGYVDVTTRANLQLREIGASKAVELLQGLQELGLVSRGSGADNIRNVTATPTSGIDPQEFIETLPLAKELHYYILNHREMYGLPRKFNVAFEGGGLISSLQDTNDIGYQAVKVAADNATNEVLAGVYFRLQLGGITGHLDFAKDTGVILSPGECIQATAAMVKVFIEHGDRTDRKKARLKYLLDAWGVEKFLEETQKKLSFKLRRFPVENCVFPPTADRTGHVGFHSQKQDGLQYVGVVLPVGRITAQQMRKLADVAERYGSGTIRLTVWQNMLISDIRIADVEAVQQALLDMGLDCQASNIRSGLVACTGNAGCKYAASNTKRQAMVLAKYVEERVELDQPVNIHLTGCHHSCAQHYIGDIGLIATKVEVGEEMVEGYHLLVGGGYAQQAAMGRVVFESLPFDQVPPVVERLLAGYLRGRKGAEESFQSFTAGQSVEELRTLALQVVDEVTV